MCTCSICEATDKLATSGFGEWPRGNPAGAKAKADYAAHLRYCLAWGPGRVPEIPAGIWKRDPFPCKGTSFVSPKLKIPQSGARSTAEYVETFNEINKLCA